MNSYKVFLDNVVDVKEYCVQTALEDWLDGFGPIVIPEAVAGRENRKPWSRQSGQVEDITSLNIKENMNRISKNFCSWLKKLPGDDLTVNNYSEGTIKKLFDVMDEDVDKDILNTSRYVHKLWAKIAKSIKLIDMTFGDGVYSNKDHVDLEVLAVKSPTNTKDRKRKHGAKKRRRLTSSKEKLTPANYGAWYLEPKSWNKFYQNHYGSQTKIVPTRKLKNYPPKGAAGEMPSATKKAFQNFLRDSNHYSKTKILSEILD